MYCLLFEWVGESFETSASFSSTLNSDWASSWTSLAFINSTSEVSFILESLLIYYSISSRIIISFIINWLLRSLHCSGRAWYMLYVAQVIPHAQLVVVDDSGDFSWQSSPWLLETVLPTATESPMLASGDFSWQSSNSWSLSWRLLDSVTPGTLIENGSPSGST